MKHLTSTAVTKIWIWLLALTVIEVALVFPRLSPLLFLFVLLGLSAGKSAMILGWFMNLKFAARSLTYILIPFLLVCIGLLLAFLPDARRVREMLP